MGLKPLTEKEIKEIKSAVKTIGKFARYIDSVNALNASLERNLAESIKAGDVTNAQKVAISCQESAEKEYSRVQTQIAKKFPCPTNCNCDNDKHANCPAHNALIVADFMRGVARGSSWDWNSIFEWACMGRWEWIKQHGYRTGPDNPDEALRQMEKGVNSI